MELKNLPNWASLRTQLGLPKEVKDVGKNTVDRREAGGAEPPTEEQPQDESIRQAVCEADHGEHDLEQTDR